MKKKQSSRNASSNEIILKWSNYPAISKKMNQMQYTYLLSQSKWVSEEQVNLHQNL